MMVVISTYIAGIYPPLILEASADSDIETIQPRVSRVKCLDNTVELDHQGTCHGDRTLVINAKLTEAENQQLNSMLENYTEFTLATPQGMFYGMIENRSGNQGSVTLRFLVGEKLG